MNAQIKIADLVKNLEATSLRAYPKLNLFKGSNVEFNPSICEATSYGWWKFVSRIGGLVVFNDYRYSVSTSKHQWKVRSLLNQLGIEIDLFIEAPQGLQNLDDAVRYYEVKIKCLNEDILKPRSQAAKNLERKGEIKALQVKIKAIKKLIGKRK